MKTSKIIGLGLGVLGVVGGVYWIITKTRKTYGELDRREKENDQILVKSGLTKEEVDQLSSEENQEGSETAEKPGGDIRLNLCRKLFEGVLYGKANIPIDCLNVDDCKKTEKVTHVLQRFDDRLGREVLDFLFEIPTSALPDYRDGGERIRRREDGYTSVKDFSKAIKGEYDVEQQKSISKGFSGDMEMIVQNEQFLGFKMKGGNLEADSRVDGYIYLKYDKKDENGEWDTYSKFMKIPKEICRQNPWNEKHQRVTDFVFDLKEAMKTEPQETLGKLLTHGGDPEIIRNPRIVDTFAAIRVTFCIQGGQFLDGINITSGCKILEKIYEDLIITGTPGPRYGSGECEFRYDNFLFYDPDEDEVVVFDYSMDDNGDCSVVESSYV